MRAAIPILAVLMLVPSVAFSPSLGRGQGEGHGPGGEVRRVEGQTLASSGVAAVKRSDVPAALPAPQPPPQPSPKGEGTNRAGETLELVSIPTITGSKAAAPRTITRAEAVASVIRSREYQDTVTPLARLYLATFGRFPDYEGINYYTGQREEARPLASIADEFVGSPEFRQLYGNPDNAQFVELMFENVLGNPGQADVRNYWIEELNTGRMTRGQVLIDLAESGFFRERSNNQILVSTAYIEILRRTPDPEGYARWVAHLNAGNPYRSVIDGLLATR